jgi:hypothetical protein
LAAGGGPAAAEVFVVRAEAPGVATLSFDYLPATSLSRGPAFSQPLPAAAPGGAANRVSVIVTVHSLEDRTEF